MDKKLIFQLKTLMAGRVIIVTLFLGSLLFFQHRFGHFPSPSYIRWLIASTYFLTLVYAVLFPRVSSVRPFIIIQIFGDLIIESGIIYATGGIESPFPFLFMLSIISAGILLSRAGGYFIAFLSTILYGLLAAISFYRFINPLDFYYTVFINISAFFLVAFLTGHLVEVLRRTGEKLEEKSAAWEELQAFHEHIVRNMDSGLFTTDLVGRITSFNEAAERITGYSFQEVRGSLCSQLFDFPFLDDLFQNPSDIQLPSESLRQNEGGLVNKMGRKLYLSLNLSLLKDEQERIKGVIGVFHDLTEQKEMEEQIKRADQLATIGKVASGMAHEIRNPLASISGSVQLLKTELALEGTHQRLLNIVVTEAERLDQLISDFLEYAQPNPLLLQPYDIHQLLEETLHLFGNGQGLLSRLEIVTSFEPKEIRVSIDPGQMRQAFRNLCLNAISSMPSGGTLSLSTRLLKKQESADLKFPRASKTINSIYEDVVEITLSDTGAGIFHQDKASVFDPFSTAKDRGNGLGLAIAQRIIEEHGGFMEVEGDIGKGSAFRIYLSAEDDRRQEIDGIE